MNAKLYTSAWLIGALVILLVNDYYLKATFSNWFTGKLSDFSGLLLVGLIVAAHFKRHRTQ